MLPMNLAGIARLDDGQNPSLVYLVPAISLQARMRVALSAIRGAKALVTDRRAHGHADHGNERQQGHRG